MAERRRVVNIADYHGVTTVSVTDEQVSMIKSCIWNPRPFELVYDRGHSELFGKVFRVEVTDDSPTEYNYIHTVKHVLLPRAEA